MSMRRRRKRGSWRTLALQWRTLWLRRIHVSGWRGVALEVTALCASGAPVRDQGLQREHELHAGGGHLQGWCTPGFSTLGKHQDPGMRGPRASLDVHKQERRMWQQPQEDPPWQIHKLCSMKTFQGAAWWKPYTSGLAGNTSVSPPKDCYPDRLLRLSASPRRATKTSWIAKISLGWTTSWRSPWRKDFV